MDASPVDTHAHAFGDEILRCEVGSTAHGTGVGHDDLDMLAVVVPPKPLVIGVNTFEHYGYRTAVVRTGKANARSEPGDVDLTFYSLSKFIRLAQKGNPAVLGLFFAPTLYITEVGEELRKSVGLFHTKSAGAQFLGYMKSQRHRMTDPGDEEEGIRPNRGRPELIEKYGYDTKFAYHLIRLGMQGYQFVRYGRISMPLPEYVRDMLLAIRHGQYPLEQVLGWSKELEDQLKEAIEDSDLPTLADTHTISDLSVRLHEQHWASVAQCAK